MCTAGGNPRYPKILNHTLEEAPRERNEQKVITEFLTTFSFTENESAHTKKTPGEIGVHVLLSATARKYFCVSLEKLIKKPSF